MLYLLGQFTLTYDEVVHLVVAHRLGELHIHFLILTEGIHYLLDAFLYDFENGLAVIQLGLLLQISHAVARRPDHFALV